MKLFLKVFSILFVSGILFSSCSRTRDAAGLDSIYNIVKTGKWESVVSGVGDNISAEAELVPANGYAKFLDQTIQIYNENETTTGTPISYSFKDTKTIILNGTEYKIEENFVSTTKTITARANNATNSYFIFKRDR